MKNTLSLPPIISVIFLIISCKDKSTDVSNTILSVDTSVSQVVSDTNIAKNDSVTIAQPATLIKDELEIVQSEILFDADFNPSVSAELKNNMEEDIVAIELIVDPNDKYKTNCKVISIRKKINIEAGSTKSVKERIREKVDVGCLKVEYAKIYLGDFILSSGKENEFAINFF
jgi:hypothetical protein